MKFLWIILAAFALVALAVICFAQNVANFFYNLFHKTKRLYSWSIFPDNTPGEYDHYADEAKMTYYKGGWIRQDGHEHELS